MAASSKDLLVAISYSLPHSISIPAGVIVAGYLVILYINTYKWNAKDFGTLYSFYFLSVSIFQFAIALLLQFVGTSTDEVIGLRNCKITQVINISVHAGKLFPYLVSLFFIILLPVLKLRHDDNTLSLETSGTQSESDKPESNNEQEVSKPAFHTKLLESRCFYYLIYFFAILQGYGWGAYEICDRLLPTYMTKDASYLSSTNDLIRGFFICAIPLVIVVFSKLLKNKYPEYTVYLAIASFLLVILVPVCVLFFLYTHSPGGLSNSVDAVPATTNPDYLALVGLLLLEIIPPLLNLTCPAIIQYISTQLLDNDSDFRIYASTLYLVFFFLGSVFYKAFAQVVTLPKKTVSYICIATYSIAYLLVLPHKFSWNKRGFTYYILICVFNLFVMVALINSNIIITNQMADDNHKKYRWLIQGCMYLIKNSFLALLMKLIYNTYDKEKRLSDGAHPEEQLPEEDAKPITHSFKFNFRNLFIIIYFISQIASIIATALYKEHVFKT